MLTSHLQMRVQRGQRVGKRSNRRTTIHLLYCNVNTIVKEGIKPFLGLAVEYEVLSCSRPDHKCESETKLQRLLFFG